MKKPSIDLRKELMKLRHDDKEAFLRLVAEMTSIVADPDFREIAAFYSSWPVNVPAWQVRPRRKKKAATGYYVRNREQ
jgi:hypothetical protein